MKGLRTAHRYAKSLIQLGQEKSNLDAFASELEGVISLYNESKDLRITMASPLIKNDDKAKVFEAIFPSLNSDLKSFFNVVINNGRGNQLAAISESFLDKNRELKGIVSATLTSATKLDQTQIEKILAKAGLDKAKTQLTEQVDPSIIGGFILRMGDRQIDASIERRFSDMKVQLN